MGTNTIPIPNPVSASGAARSQADSPPADERMTRSETTSPAAIVAIPICMVGARSDPAVQRT